MVCNGTLGAIHTVHSSASRLGVARFHSHKGQPRKHVRSWHISLLHRLHKTADKQYLENWTICLSTAPTCEIYFFFNAKLTAHSWKVFCHLSCNFTWNIRVEPEILYDMMSPTSLLLLAKLPLKMVSIATRWGQAKDIYSDSVLSVEESLCHSASLRQDSGYLHGDRPDVFCRSTAVVVTLETLQHLLISQVFSESLSSLQIHCTGLWQMLCQIQGLHHCTDTL